MSFMLDSIWFDKYEEFLLKAEGQEIANCEEGSDTCMANYLHYADDVFCEAGRSCFPASYLNVNQLQQNSECHTDDCNSHKWTPTIPGSLPFSDPAMTKTGLTALIPKS